MQTNPVIILASMVPSVILAAALTEPKELEKEPEFGVLPADSYACYNRDQYKRQTSKHFFTIIEYVAGIVEGCAETTIDRPVIILSEGDIVEVDLTGYGHRWTERKLIE